MILSRTQKRDLNMNAKEEADKFNAEMNQQCGNSEKVAMALGAGIKSIFEKEKPSLDDFANLFLNGMSALRAQIIFEVLMKVSNDGKAFSVPNNGEHLKELMAIFAMHAARYANATLADFKDVVEKVAPDRVAVEMIDDPNDPRINPTPASAPEGSTVH